jgi:hypothetical protein
VSGVLVTVAVNAAWPPSTKDPVAGVTVTVIEGGGGGGDGGVLAEPQPSVHAPSARSAANTIVLVLGFFLLLCERDCMSSQKQANGQRRGEGTEVREWGIVKRLDFGETALNQYLGEF